MEVRIRLLQSKVQEFQAFKFHPNCQSPQLTCLYFAYDLRVFSYADQPSILLIKYVLEEFKGLSGLATNAEKSDMYCAG